MLKDLTRIIVTAKAAVDILKEKLETKSTDLLLQIKQFTDKVQSNSTSSEQPKSNLKEKAKEELFELISEITHRAQINELQIKSFIKDKLIELTNNAFLDSMELNDIRAEIAGLRAEIADMKEQIRLQRR